jgi:uroporphyrinogen decarboxylase
MPKDVAWEDYFGFDRAVRICPDNSPRFPRRVIEETERYRIETTPWGGTQKVFNVLDSTPEVLKFYYDTPEKWEEAKKAMYTYHEDRIPWKYLEANYPRWKAEGRFMQLVVWFGFDVAHTRLTGTENMLISMYEDPDWVTDIFDTYLNTSLDLCQRILDAGYEFDGIFWYDDMGYKGTTFFSPNTYRTLLKPYHTKAVQWAHDHGIVAQLHSCGDVMTLVPDLMDIGIDGLNPLEVKAGMDSIDLKRRYGDRLTLHGGINAQIWDQTDVIMAEIDRLLPVLKENGGYIFSSDHSVPNSVSLDNFRRIVERAKRKGAY